MFFSNTHWTQLLVPLHLKFIPIHIHNFEHSRVIMNMKWSSFLIHRNINRRENKAQIPLKGYSNPKYIFFVIIHMHWGGCRRAYAACVRWIISKIVLRWSGETERRRIVEKKSFLIFFAYKKYSRLIHSSKKHLQHIQLSDTTGTSNGTGFYGQMKLKHLLFSSKHSTWLTQG